MGQTESSSLPVRASDLLATGLGTATVMWIAGYLTHMPLVQPYIPGPVVFVLLAIILFAGGYVFGRDSTRGWDSAWIAPLITALVNMLIFASVLKDEKRSQAMIALPGFIAVTLIVMLIGFAVGKSRRRKLETRHAHWRFRLALVPVLATALVVSAGGLVTGFDAGFSVPDWPTTYQSNMFLYPISGMTGGIYYEHTHRMAASLVGFIAIILMAWTWIADKRRSVCIFTTVALLMVVGQGIAGGLWVESASLPYVLFHGSFGQMILGTFAVLAAAHAPSWRKEELPLQTPGASTDHLLSVLLLVALIVQTLLGVYVRKSPMGPWMVHMSFAGVVAMLVVAVGIRGLAVYGNRLPPIKRISHGLLHGVLLQVLLGFAALGMRQQNQGAYLKPGDTATSGPLDATITTLHQSVGALLLMFAALMVAWSWKLLKKQKSI